MSCISGFLIILLGHRDLSFEDTLQFIKVACKVAGLEGSNIMFRVNSNIQMIFLISKEWKNTSSSTQSIIVSELCKR